MLGDIIKARREAAKMTQESLALQVKATQATISRIEKGRQLPSSALLYKIAHTLKMDSRILFAASAEMDKTAEKGT